MRTRSKLGLAALAVVLLGGAAFVRFVVYPESATLEASAGQGASPTLPAPNPTLMPTVNIARVARWENGAKPQAADGLQVAAYAEGFDHPRWMYLLPNGDVLVAEANKPQTDDPSTGVADWVADKVKSLAGAGVKSPDRIVLLRDANGDGVAEERHVLPEGPALALRHGAGRAGPLRRQRRRPGAGALPGGPDRDHRDPGEGRRPAVRHQPPLDQERHREPRRRRSSSSRSARTAMSARTASTRRRAARRSGNTRSPRSRCANTPPACATPTASASSP